MAEGKKAPKTGNWGQLTPARGSTGWRRARAGAARGPLRRAGPTPRAGTFAGAPPPIGGAGHATPRPARAARRWSGRGPPAPKTNPGPAPFGAGPYTAQGEPGGRVGQEEGGKKARPSRLCPFLRASAGVVGGRPRVLAPRRIAPPRRPGPGFRAGRGPQTPKIGPNRRDFRAGRAGRPRGGPGPARGRAPRARAGSPTRGRRPKAPEAVPTDRDLYPYHPIAPGAESPLAL